MIAKIDEELACIWQRVKIKGVSVTDKAYQILIKKEIAFFKIVGAEFVSEDEQKKRITTCESCNTHFTDGRRCNICKCFMDCKTWLKTNPISIKNKIIKCPENKWL